MVRVKTVCLFIRQYEGETEEEVRKHLNGLGCTCFYELGALAEMPAEMIVSAFAFTDDRAAADALSEKGIGFAVYDNEYGRAQLFPDALYRVERLCTLEKKRIDRMLCRYLGLPWDILETERCLIRELREEDVDDLYGLYLPEDYFLEDEPLYRDRERERAYTRDYIRYQYRFFEYGLWAVIEKETGRLIGRAGLSNRPGYDDPELGYGFAPDHRRMGFASEVCLAILYYAAQELSREAVNAFTRKENEASVRLLEKLGFYFVRTVLLDGQAFDHYRKIL
ncbi:MAG: GNAT family N-acetyltransferase [Lachnospiraceae bacterium]|nr:GNAT family N-acetyltransferase [Lachnospiraceae bacterium]